MRRVSGSSSIRPRFPDVAPAGLEEVEALLGEGRAVGAKPLAEYLEVRGYADAAQWVYPVLTI